MIVERILEPVGHGGFYRERISNIRPEEGGFWFAGREINIVYDCGSTNKKKLTEKIAQLPVEDIDVLFLSHFDTDHVNGITELAEKCRIHNVVMPDIRRHRALYLAECVVQKRVEADTVRMLGNPELFFAGLQEDKDVRTEVFYVGNGRDYEEGGGQDHRLASGSDVMLKVLKKKINWMWCPFNYNYDAVMPMVELEVENLILNASGLPEVDYEWMIRHMRELRPKLNAIFKKYNKGVKGDVNYSNVNSMVLYSGPNPKRASDVAVHFGAPYTDLEKRVGQKAGMLYCGDYNAADSVCFQELESFAERFEDNIGGVMLPHHGSRHSYNSKLRRLAPVFFVSVGVRKGLFRGDFPHEEVAADVTDKRELVQITDQDWTGLVERIGL